MHWSTRSIRVADRRLTTSRVRHTLARELGGAAGVPDLDFYVVGDDDGAVRVVVRAAEPEVDRLAGWVGQRLDELLPSTGPRAA